MGLTSTATLTQELMTLLSAEMLIATDDLYLFYENGPIQHADPDVQTPGANVISFNRPVLPTGTYSETSRRLTDGTPISTTALAISMTQVSLTTREYAGPHDGTNVLPFGLTEFLKNRAKHNLVAMVGEFLRRDRQKFLNTTISDLLLAAAIVVTPDGSAPGVIAANQAATTNWLRSWNKTMKDNKIPTFGNGKWRMILNTTDEQSLKGDEQYREAARYLANANPIFRGMVMSYENFDIMTDTTLSTTGVGAGSAVTGRQSVAYGPYGIGHGIGMAPTVRAADDTDFGRSDKVLWKSEEAVGTLYSDLLTRGVTT